jgi:hypothetical protein
LALYARVFNVSRQYSMKHKQALRAVENCACAWVEFGVSIRDLTLAESIAARNQQTQKPLGLVYIVEGKGGKLISKPIFSELPTCVYRPTERNQAQTREGHQLVKAANQFAEMGA